MECGVLSETIWVRHRFKLKHWVFVPLLLLLWSQPVSLSDHEKALLYIGYTVDCSIMNRIVNKILYISTLHFKSKMPNSDLTLKKISKYLLEPGPTPWVLHLLGMGRYPPFKEQGWTADIDRALTFPLTHIEHCSKFGTSLFFSDYDCYMKLTKPHTTQMNFSHTLTVQATKNIVLFNNISYKLLTATVLQLCVSYSFVINVILVAATCLSTSVPLF